VHEPSQQAAISKQMWETGDALRIWIDGKTLDFMAHHAVFDGVRGVRLVNEILGNLQKKGAIRPQDLPCCLLACSVPAMTRVVAVERPQGTLREQSDGLTHHESHYLRVPTALIKCVKETHGQGFASSMQGLLLWTLFRCGTPNTLHVASTIGFKSDWWSALGSAFNHYGAFPFAANDCPTPQEVAKCVTKGHTRNGRISGFPCLLGNTSSGGLSGIDIAEMYRAIDVLIGGGPLIMDGSCGYDSYVLYKFRHTVPVYIFYATICDNIDISIQSRVPLPGIEKAFYEGLALLAQSK